MPSGFFERRVHELETGEPVVPFQYADLEREALEQLPNRLANHVLATPGRGTTYDANRSFDRWQIVPRVFRDVTACTLETELFGQTLPSPMMLAPIGRQCAYHPMGEVASARAAEQLSVPFSVSSVASTPIETVANEMPTTPRLFQLYWPADWDVAGSLLERAEEAGYAGILLTVDFQAGRWVPEDICDPTSPNFGTTNANFATDPVSDYTPEQPGDPTWEKQADWEELAFLQGHTDLPIYLKGIVHPADAERAVASGADGIVVSNHGARQIDGAIGSIEALPRVIETIDGRIPVLFDSGIRSGADIFKALALGADGVMVGRPYLFGLTLAGEQGVYETAHNLLAELESIAGLAGCTAIDEIDRSILRKIY